MVNKRAQPAKRGAVTIRDVAEAAGVSTATVSHVFSRRRPVSQTAAEHVTEVAAKLGYRANTNARGLATGRSYVVALHLPFGAQDIALSPFLASILTTISMTASAEGYGFVLIPADDAAAAAHAAALVAARRIDGALLLDPNPSGALLTTLRGAGLPITSIGRVAGNPDVACVDGNVEAWVDDALSHLRDRGYTRPALLTVDAQTTYFQDVRAHYREWCATAGSQAMIFDADALTEDAAFRAVRSSRGAPYDAFLCANDVLGSAALRALTTDSDETFGVIGIGDSFYASHAVPPLTTISTRPIEQGRLATEMLITLLDGGDPDHLNVIVPHELVVRDSTPPRGRASHREMPGA